MQSLWSTASRCIGPVLASVCLVTGGSLAATTQPAGQDVPPVIRGTMTRTANAGHWRTFINSAGARVLEADKDAIWFWMGGCVCRYNVKTTSIDVQTDLLTHGSLRNCGYTALAGDGRFATSGYMYLWTPGKGWSRLPQPMPYANDVANAPSIGFDAAGKMWAFGFKKTCLWKDDAWEDPVEGPPDCKIFPVGGGWLVMNGSVDWWCPGSLEKAGSTIYRGMKSLFGGRCFAAGGVRDTRMLLSNGNGVFEWDVKADTWAYLEPYSGELAFFDAKGRRIFAGMNRILVYRGDPSKLQ